MGSIDVQATWSNPCVSRREDIEVTVEGAEIVVGYYIDLDTITVIDVFAGDVEISNLVGAKYQAIAAAVKAALRSVV